MSATSDYTLETSKFDIISDDRIILLTDGVYNLLSKKDIRDISLASKKVEDLALNIKGKIQELGPIDDYTAIIFQK